MPKSSVEPRTPASSAGSSCTTATIHLEAARIVMQGNASSGSNHYIACPAKWPACPCDEWGRVRRASSETADADSFSALQEAQEGGHDNKRWRLRSYSRNSRDFEGSKSSRGSIRNDRETHSRKSSRFTRRRSRSKTQDAAKKEVDWVTVECGLPLPTVRQ
ncbi:hypothetical protein PHYSODRAFT_300893 [Phytophthora sojae]|uniref:Uncharacterized protein n=1 Tax=Phytophthora sojae (strain P6497) TaxID=1094619 RepID=G4ZHI2_PHYSP|nr:hypothetical protein PHYSODRAFT_300893 [Phytophthora sojae]EGZ18062.1 hypothetical protein PHYSODRAFT_300893 [Phytophthora sojae]|eukprot:XP_009527120.1 hypothetical protein PHYSODRAFT_300893 [Phytophthora sojae]